MSSNPSQQIYHHTYEVAKLVHKKPKRGGGQKKCRVTLETIFQQSWPFETHQMTSVKGWQGQASIFRWRLKSGLVHFCQWFDRDKWEINIP